MIVPSHSRDAECRAMKRADFRLAADRKAKCQNFSRVAGIDQPVVVNPGGREQRGRLALELLDHALLLYLKRYGVDGAARALPPLFADDGKDARGLLAAHYRDAVIGPGKNEARVEGAATH